MRNMSETKKFLNVEFKVEKNPAYTGNHYLARVNRVGNNTYPLGTTEQEMIDQYHNEIVLQKDIDGKTVRVSDIHRVVEIARCYEDCLHADDLRLTHD